MSRPDWRGALARSGLLDLLAAHDPHVAGTPPLGLDLPGSDIDLLCHAPSGRAFAQLMWDRLRDTPDFALRQWIAPPRAVIATVTLHGWPFEIFGSPDPVARQPGWLHFDVERRLLALGGDALRQAVMRCRRRGLKTEPAFAAVLGLAGDPYGALAGMAAWDDGRLAACIRRAAAT